MEVIPTLKADAGTRKATAGNEDTWFPRAPVNDLGTMVIDVDKVGWRKEGYLDGIFLLGFEQFHFFGRMAYIPQISNSRFTTASEEMAVGRPAKAVDTRTRFESQDGFSGPSSFAEVVNPHAVADGAAVKVPESKGSHCKIVYGLRSFRDLDLLLYSFLIYLRPTSSMIGNKSTSAEERKLPSYQVSRCSCSRAIDLIVCLTVRYHWVRRMWWRRSQISISPLILPQMTPSPTIKLIFKLMLQHTIGYVNRYVYRCCSKWRGKTGFRGLGCCCESRTRYSPR